MKNYVIYSDTSCDMEKKYREQWGVEYAKVHIHYDETDYLADLDWEIHGSAKGYYDVIRSGKRIFSSQITTQEYTAEFEKWLEKGYDVLYLACSSKISASVNAAVLAANDLAEKYPDNKVVVVDTRRACGALFFLVMEASKLKQNGASIEETEKWVRENIDYVHQLGTVADLKYLKQAGRVSASAAFFGGLFQVKPIIISDAKGQNFAIGKVKGRKQSLDKLVEIFKTEYDPSTYPTVIISNADCEDEALYLKEQVMANGVKEEDIIISTIGPAVGSAVGPGMISLYYYGTEVTVNRE